MKPSGPPNMPQPTFAFRAVTKILSAYNTIRHGSKSMEAITSQHIKDSIAATKVTVPWTDDEPHPQSYHVFDPAPASWVSKTPSDDADKKQAASSEDEIDTIALHSWNIDFMLPFGPNRMRPALAHLGARTAALPPGTAAVIFLQEMTPSDLSIIASTPWIRERFHITDVDPSNWATTHYGTTTLVDRRLRITSVFRVHYAKTRMQRDGLFVDVAGPAATGGKTVRLCNSHLESLALNPPFRPPQMELIARHLREEGVYAGLAAGDFNAIQPFDRTLHTDNGLKDAYLELGGQEDSKEGYTWGKQASTKSREQFGCSRMDKVFYCGGAEVVKFEQFGEDVMTEGEEECEFIIGLGFDKAWVTDHLGVMALVKFNPDKNASKI